MVFYQGYYIMYDANDKSKKIELLFLGNDKKIKQRWKDANELEQELTKYITKRNSKHNDILGYKIYKLEETKIKEYWR